MERLAELNSLLNTDEKAMPQDQEKEVDQVADLPRRSVNYAGRVIRRSKRENRKIFSAWQIENHTKKYGKRLEK